MILMMRRIKRGKEDEEDGTETGARCFERTVLRLPSQEDGTDSTGDGETMK